MNIVVYNILVSHSEEGKIRVVWKNCYNYLSKYIYSKHSVLPGYIIILLVAIGKEYLIQSISPHVSLDANRVTGLPIILLRNHISIQPRKMPITHNKSICIKP